MTEVDQAKNPLADVLLPVRERLLPKGGSSTGLDLEVVSHCPQCGSPIYGRKTMRSTDPYAPGVRYSCSCRLSQM